MVTSKLFLFPPCFPNSSSLGVIKSRDFSLVAENNFSMAQNIFLSFPQLFQKGFFPGVGVESLHKTKIIVNSQPSSPCIV